METMLVIVRKNRTNCEVGGAVSPNSVFCHGPTQVFDVLMFPILSVALTYRILSVSQLYAVRSPLHMLSVPPTICRDVTIFFKIIIFNICLHNLVCFGETLSKLLLFFWYVEKWGRYARFCISKYSPKCLHRYKVNWQISVTHWNNKYICYAFLDFY